METPGTSDELKKLCVSYKVEENRGKYENPIVSSILDQDERKLLTIFPEEIWREILAKVNRPSLESVYNASSLFQRLLYPDRQLFLFSSVWKALGVQYEVHSDPVYCDLNLEDGDLNHARHTEEKVFSVILKLRLVCRDWCLGINKFYEDLYHNYDTKESILQPRVQSGLDSADEAALNRKYGREDEIKKMGGWSEYKFDTVAKLQDFLVRFGNTHNSRTNPFPFRKVIFDSGDSRDGELLRFWSKVIELLTEYGRHIWFCDLSFPMNDDYPYPYMDLKIEQILSLLPKLKVLRFPLKDYYPLGNESNEIIEETLITYPIPERENLTFLSASSPKILMQHFLGYNAKVNKIEIFSLRNLDFGNIDAPNLTQLAICFKTMREFEMFENCGPEWNLKMLHVTFIPFVSHPRIFKCLEQWKESLTDVVVNFPPAKRAQDKVSIVRNFGIRLDLPYVKRLRVRMSDIRSLDFILPMITLQLLEFSPRSWDAEDWETIPKNLSDKMKMNEMIQFHSLQDKDMYNSNIWAFFPKPRRIHVGQFIFDDFHHGPAYIREKAKTLKRQLSEKDYDDIFHSVISKFKK